MELGASYQVSSALQFWQELDDLLSPVSSSSARLEEIDYALKSFLLFSAHFYDEYLKDELSLDHWTDLAMSSRLFSDYSDRSTDKIVAWLLTKDDQEDDPHLLYLCLLLLQKRGEKHHHVFRSLRQSKAVPLPETNGGASASQGQESISVMLVMMRIIEKYGKDSLHIGMDQRRLAATERLGLAATHMLYEICRVSRLNSVDLALFTKAFIEHLFQLIENTRDTEAFNYSLVKLVCSLNEQFMVSSLASSAPAEFKSPSKRRKSVSEQMASAEKQESENNVVLSTIKEFLGLHKTFGENLIFILNRCGSLPEDLCVSLLILKLLYLLFTTPSTQDYFYTNDLCVLVDVFIRELNDLPEENEGLRHTYLRVLHPLLTNTQLKQIPYKRRQIRRVLNGLVADYERRHVNLTTKRLVERNLKASWCAALDAEDAQSNPTLPVEPPATPTFSVISASEENLPLPSDPDAGSDSGRKTPPRMLDRHPYIQTADSEARRGSTASVAAASSSPRKHHGAAHADRKHGRHQLSTSSAGNLGASVDSLPLQRHRRSSDTNLHARHEAEGSRPSSASAAEVSIKSMIAIGQRRKPPEPPRHKKKGLIGSFNSVAAEATGRRRSSSELPPPPHNLHANGSAVDTLSNRVLHMHAR